MNKKCLPFNPPDPIKSRGLELTIHLPFKYVPGAYCDTKSMYT